MRLFICFNLDFGMFCVKCMLLELFQCVGGSFCFRQLVDIISTHAFRSFAERAIFGKEHGCMSFRLIPVMETGSLDMAAHFAANVYCFGIVSPRAPQIYAVIRNTFTG